jgi:PAS domain S-box-containing protein
MSSNSDLVGTGPGVSHPPPLHDGLRLLLQTTLDAVVVMTAAGTVADWNDRAVSTFGWTRDEVVGRAMADLIIPARYRDAHQNGLKRYLETGKAVVLGRRIQVSGLRKDGEEFPLELSISPVETADGLAFVGCLRDMTDIYALRQARAEVARVTQRMAMDERQPRSCMRSTSRWRRFPPMLKRACAGSRVRRPISTRRVRFSRASSPTAAAPRRWSPASA